MPSAESILVAGANHIQTTLLEKTKSLEKQRDGLKAKREFLFQEYLKRPQDTRLSLEIRVIDDQVAECIEQIGKLGRTGIKT